MHQEKAVSTSFPRVLHSRPHSAGNGDAVRQPPDVVKNWGAALNATGLKNSVKAVHT